MPLIGGPVTLNHSQVTGNTAAHGGGIFNFGGTVTLAKTSLTGNNPGQLRTPRQHRWLHRVTPRPGRSLFSAFCFAWSHRPHQAPPQNVAIAGGWWSDGDYLYGRPRTNAGRECLVKPK